MGTPKWVPRVGVQLGGPSNYHQVGATLLSCSLPPQSPRLTCSLAIPLPRADVGLGLVRPALTRSEDLPRQSSVRSGLEAPFANLYPIVVTLLPPLEPQSWQPGGMRYLQVQHLGEGTVLHPQSPHGQLPAPAFSASQPLGEVSRNLPEGILMRRGGRI